MSTARRASSVTGLRRGVGTAKPAEHVEPIAAVPQPPPQTKPVRVTLNLPPELYRQLARWADFAADELGRSRVSVQDALRAMVHAGVADASSSSPVLAELRRS